MGSMTMSVAFGRAPDAPSTPIVISRVTRLRKIAGSRLGTGVSGTGFRPPC